MWFNLPPRLKFVCLILGGLLVPGLAAAQSPTVAPLPPCDNPMGGILNFTSNGVSCTCPAGQTNFGGYCAPPRDPRCPGWATWNDATGKCECPSVIRGPGGSAGDVPPPASGPGAGITYETDNGVLVSCVVDCGIVRGIYTTSQGCHCIPGEVEGMDRNAPRHHPHYVCHKPCDPGATWNNQTGKCGPSRIGNVPRPVHDTRISAGYPNPYPTFEAPGLSWGLGFGPGFAGHGGHGMGPRGLAGGGLR
jgi:hypothetical protein